MANKEVLITIILYNLLLIAIGFLGEKKEPITKMIFILVVEV